MYKAALAPRDARAPILCAITSCGFCDEPARSIACPAPDTQVVPKLVADQDQLAIASPQFNHISKGSAVSQVTGARNSTVVRAQLFIDADGRQAMATRAPRFSTSHSRRGRSWRACARCWMSRWWSRSADHRRLCGCGQQFTTCSNQAPPVAVLFGNRIPEGDDDDDQHAGCPGSHRRSGNPARQRRDPRTDQAVDSRGAGCSERSRTGWGPAGRGVTRTARHSHHPPQRAESTGPRRT